MTTPNDPAAAIALEAANWHLELQAADCSLEMRADFVRWLRQSPLHVSEYLKVLALQADLGRLPAFRTLDVEALLAQVQPASSPVQILAFPRRVRRPGIPELPAEPPLPRRRRMAWVSGAAAALIGLLLLGLAARQTLRGAVHYQTGLGEQRTVMLHDGSQVRINVRSDLDVHVDARTRELTLQNGEALFQVAKDPSHPFRVRTPEAVIEAKGTQFDVRVRDGRTVVVLLEGHVEVTSPGATTATAAAGPRARPAHAKQVTLDPGQSVVVDAAAAQPLVPRRTDLASATAWLQGRLIFDDTPLSQVVEEFNRYAGEQVIIDDPAAGNIRVTASFEAGSVPSFARSVGATAALRVTREADGRWHIGSL